MPTPVRKSRKQFRAILLGPEPEFGIIQRALRKDTEDALFGARVNGDIYRTRNFGPIEPLTQRRGRFLANRENPSVLRGKVQRTPGYIHVQFEANAVCRGKFIKEKFPFDILTGRVLQTRWTVQDPDASIAHLRWRPRAYIRTWLLQPVDEKRAWRRVVIPPEPIPGLIKSRFAIGETFPYDGRVRRGIVHNTGENIDPGCPTRPIVLDEDFDPPPILVPECC